MRFTCLNSCTQTGGPILTIPSLKNLVKRRGRWCLLSFILRNKRASFPNSELITYSQLSWGSPSPSEGSPMSLRRILRSCVFLLLPLPTASVTPHHSILSFLLLWVLVSAILTSLPRLGILFTFPTDSFFGLNSFLSSSLMCQFEYDCPGRSCLGHRFFCSKCLQPSK